MSPRDNGEVDQQKKRDRDEISMNDAIKNSEPEPIQFVTVGNDLLKLRLRAEKRTSKRQKIA